MTATVTHTFNCALADDPKASAAGEILVSHWNANHTVSGIRDILTANRNYYVSTTGSDSHGGTNSTTDAWATLQHAMDFIAANLDFGGFSIYVNIGAGSFAGVGVRGTVGGGVLIFKGAGSSSTTITAGSNDGVTNLGECFGFDFFTSTGTVICAHRVTCKSWVNGSSAISMSDSGWFFYLCDQNALEATDIVFDCTGISSGNSFLVDIETAASVQDQVHAGGGVTVIGASAILGGLIVAANSPGATFFAIAPWTISGTLTVQRCSATFSNGGQYINFGGTFSGGGGVSGPGCIVNTGGSAATGFQNGLLGPTFFPGGALTVDAASSYDGFPGPFPGTSTQTSTSYTLVIGDAFQTVEMNNAGANTLTVPTNASVAFNIGTKIWVTQIGAGATTVTGAAGVTLDNAGAVGGQWKTVKLYKRATDEWVQTNA